MCSWIVAGSKWIGSDGNVQTFALFRELHQLEHAQKLSLETLQLSRRLVISPECSLYRVVVLEPTKPYKDSLPDSKRKRVHICHDRNGMPYRRNGCFLLLHRSMWCAMQATMCWSLFRKQPRAFCMLPSELHCPVASWFSAKTTTHNK